MVGGADRVKGALTDGDSLLLVVVQVEESGWVSEQSLGVPGLI